MNSQGFIGAVIQYFTIEDKPRLNRRNTWFEDHSVSTVFANYFWIGFTVLAMALILFLAIKVIL